jgi:hypothetical protein
MANTHGFYVSAGLLAPEHAQRIGSAIWEFLWLISHETREGGKVLNGSSITAARIARDLGCGLRNVKLHLVHLAEEGYILRNRQKLGDVYNYTIVNSKKWNTGGVVQKTAPGGTENDTGVVQNLFPGSTTNGTANKEVDRSRYSRQVDINHKRPSAFDSSSMELAAWLPKGSWLEWCQHRKEIKKPLTPQAAKKSIESLDRCRQAGFPPKAVIDHSIANSYQGLFPPKDNSARAKAPASTYHEVETRSESIARLAMEARAI